MNEAALNYTSDGEQKRQTVPVERTRCDYGGSRTWFSCPIYWRRVAVLYFRAGQFGCRHCNRIAYLSQSEDVIGRAWRKQSKIEARLAEDWERPKGMHATTYKRMLTELDECEEVKDYGLLRLLDRLGHPI